MAELGSLRGRPCGEKLKDPDRTKEILVTEMFKVYGMTTPSRFDSWDWQGVGKRVEEVTEN